MKIQYHSLRSNSICEAELTNEQVDQLTKEFNELGKSMRTQLGCQTAAEFIKAVLAINA